MEDFVVEINQMLAEILNSNSRAMSNMIGAAKAVAFIGATILTGFIAYDMFLGKALDWKKMARIALVWFGITFYGSFLSFINTPLDLIVSTTQTAAQNDGTLYEALEQEQRIKEREHIENSRHDGRLKEISAENGWIDSALETVTNPTGLGKGLGFFDVINFEVTIREMMIDFFQWLVLSLARLAIVILNVVRTFFLIILSIFGIFSIAFSMYPGLEGSFFSWLQKYINVYLWLAAAYILEGVIVRLSHSIKTMGMYSYAVDGSEKFVDDGTYNAGLVLIALGSIIGMAMVPTITSWIINAQVGNAASKLKGKVQGSMSKVQALKGAAGGPAGMAASAAASKLS